MLFLHDFSTARLGMEVIPQQGELRGERVTVIEIGKKLLQSNELVLVDAIGHRFLVREGEVDLAIPDQNTPAIGYFSKCWLREFHGAAADRPVFRMELGPKFEPVFSFDTYGRSPRNYQCWETHSLGAGGAIGRTKCPWILREALRDETRCYGVPANTCPTLFSSLLRLGASSQKEILDGRGSE